MCIRVLVHVVAAHALGLASANARVIGAPFYVSPQRPLHAVITPTYIKMLPSALSFDAYLRCHLQGCGSPPEVHTVTPSLAHLLQMYLHLRLRRWRNVNPKHASE